MSHTDHTIDTSPCESDLNAKHSQSTPGTANAVPAPPVRRISRFRSRLIMFGNLYRSELLLSAYVGMVLAPPLGDSHRFIGEVLAFLTLMILLAGASYMVSTTIARTVVLPAAIVWLLVRSLGAFGFTHALLMGLAPLAALVLSTVVLFAILRRLASPSVIARGVIAEAFMGYLALASSFGEIFRVLNYLIVSPFNQPMPGWQSSTMLYFSMITLTSVGYGGIVPIDPYLRLVAALESMLGIFYVAVVVARLASFDRSENRKAD